MEIVRVAWVAAELCLSCLCFAGMSINFCSSKFGYSICPIFSKGHAVKIGHMGYLRLMPVIMHVLWSVVRVLIGLFCCLSEMAGSSHRRSATPQYELDASEFFTIILGTSVSSMRHVYKRRDLRCSHLIMIYVVCYITHCPKLQRLPDSFMNMLMGEDPPNT